MHFWALEYGTWDGNLSYYFFADNAGSPGAVLDSGAAANIVRTDLGNASIGGGPTYAERAWSFELASPFTATGGTTYWLGLHAGATFASQNIYWETTGTGFGHTNQLSSQGTFDNWSEGNGGTQLAFNLTGTPSGAVPEPASLALFGAGLAGLIARRRKAA